MSLEKKRKRIIKDIDELFFYLREVILEVKRFGEQKPKSGG